MVSLTGGLGNQLFQLAFILSQSSSNEIVLEKNFGLPRLNHQDQPEVCSFELPDRVTVSKKTDIKIFVRRVVNFALRMAISANRRPNSIYLRPLQLIASAIVSLYLREPRQIISPVGIGYAEIRKSAYPKLYVGYFQSYVWATAVRKEMMSLRILEPSRMLLDFKALAVSEKPLIVHVRLGDYVGIESFGIPSRTYYEEAILLQDKNSKINKIWLFSNEPEDAITFIPKIYHDRVRVVPEIGNSSSETLEMMRHGVGYVIGNSTYSWWGAFLSYTENPFVVAPSPWFKGEPSPNDLIPTNWLQIEAFRC
jgi:hypothetical protein